MVCGLLLLFVTQAQTADSAQSDTGTAEAQAYDTVKSDSVTPRSAPDVAEVPVLRSISDSAMRVAHADPKYAYANDPAYWQKKPLQKDNSGLWLAEFLRNHGRAIRNTIYVLFIIAILIILVRTWQDNGFSLFRFSRRKRAAHEELESMVAVDLDEEIRLSIQKEDWASAVRYMYLKLLSLSQEKYSEAPEFIFRDHPQGAAFRYLRRAYEYVFYGGFPLSVAQFDQLRPRFTEAFKILAV